MQRYLRHYPLTVPARAVAERAARHIRAAAARHFRGRLLDIGCGSKWKQDLVGDTVDDYVGLDHEDSVHDRSVVDLVGTAYEIPAPDDSFDCVLCTSVLEHLEEPEVALREALRVLRPGGVAVYTAPMLWHLHEAPRDFYRYTGYALEHLFAKSGFEVVEVEPMSGFWLTYGSELGYYSLSLSSVLRPLARVMIAVANLVLPRLDALEARLHPGSRQWTWMHVVVARKPTAAC